ncbi:MAG: hypothetical protein HKN26_05555, partial [Acidimicrobiales bacterium]|nr:hypothetical protein [Acidimicrobiales bacterium]
MTDADALAAVIAQQIDDYVAHNDPYLIDHTVQITSFGGVATTALTAYLIDHGLSLPKGPGQWPFKHHRVAPQAADVPDGFRVIYVVGDPRNAVLSLFRRNYQVGHYRSMQEGAEVTAVVAETLESLDSYLAADRDVFDIAGHVAAWRNHPPGYPVMFLRHEYLHDVWPGVMEFVGLDRASEPLPRRERASNWRDQPAEVQARLEALLGDVAREIESWP